MTERTRTRLAAGQPARFRAIRLAGFLCLGTLSSLASNAADPATSDPGGGKLVTARLDYQETAYTLATRGVWVMPQTRPFSREPLIQGKVIRGTLEFSPYSGDSNSIAFLWNSAAGKLFLDLNRNRDLADDAAGSFVTRERPGATHQTFTNVHLFFSTRSGSRRMTVDLTFRIYRDRVPDCSAALRSFWQGQVLLLGSPWQVGLIENFQDGSGVLEPGSLLLRPWEERNQPISLATGLAEAFPFPRKLFLGGHAYQLDWSNGPPIGMTRLLQFTEQQTALGDLEIRGSFVQRLALHNGPLLVLLNHPGARVKVPAGRYGHVSVRIQQGETEAWRDSARSSAGITVDEEKPAVLVAGGPLTNSVSVSRRGQYLNLSYQLIGADGQVYELARQDRSHPPEFAIYKTGRKIASGKFEFG